MEQWYEGDGQNQHDGGSEI